MSNRKRMRDGILSLKISEIYNQNRFDEYLHAKKKQKKKKEKSMDNAYATEVIRNMTETRVQRFKAESANAVDEDDSPKEESSFCATSKKHRLMIDHNMKQFMNKIAEGSFLEKISVYWFNKKKIQHESLNSHVFFSLMTIIASPCKIEYTSARGIEIFCDIMDEIREVFNGGSVDMRSKNDHERNEIIDRKPFVIPEFYQPKETFFSIRVCIECKCFDRITSNLLRTDSGSATVFGGFRHDDSIQRHSFKFREQAVFHFIAVLFNEDIADALYVKKKYDAITQTLFSVISALREIVMIMKIHVNGRQTSSANISRAQTNDTHSNSAIMSFMEKYTTLIDQHYIPKTILGKSMRCEIYKEVISSHLKFIEKILIILDDFYVFLKNQNMRVYTLNFIKYTYEYYVRERESPCSSLQHRNKCKLYNMTFLDYT